MDLGSVSESDAMSEVSDSDLQDGWCPLNRIIFIYDSKGDENLLRRADVSYEATARTKSIYGTSVHDRDTQEERRHPQEPEPY